MTEHYVGEPNGGCSVNDDGLKKPWQKHNTRRLDAIREEIDRLSLTDVERAVSLASLILALDEVESTLGHFASYLNDWSPRSYNNLHLQVPRLILSTEKHAVRRGDIFDVLPRVEADLAYFDPPYGSNNEKMPLSRVRYAAYYHLWTTVCLNDKPSIFGKAKRRADTSDNVACSPFEEFCPKQTTLPPVAHAHDRGEHGYAARVSVLASRRNLFRDPMCPARRRTRQAGRPHSPFYTLAPLDSLRHLTGRGPLTPVEAAGQDAVPKSLRLASLRRSLRSRNHDHSTSGIGPAMIGWVRAARATGGAMLCYVTP